MKKLLFLLLLLGAGYYIVQNFGLTSAKPVSFSATYVKSKENGITGIKESIHIDVVTDGKRFKLVEKDESGSAISVYDGEKLWTKYSSSNSSYFSTGSSDNFSAGSSEPTGEVIGEMKARDMMFWLTDELNQAQAGAGGLVAGRETLLFQIRQNRSDSTYTNQRWLDAETKVMLKSNNSIYAKQVESMLSTDIVECLTFQLRTPDPSEFRI